MSLPICAFFRFRCACAGGLRRYCAVIFTLKRGTAGMMMEFNSISFSYTENGTGAVHDISFAIPEGQFVLVCGASGCGKTTINKAD